MPVYEVGYRDKTITSSPQTWPTQDPPGLPSAREYYQLDYLPELRRIADALEKLVALLEKMA